MGRGDEEFEVCKRAGGRRAAAGGSGHADIAMRDKSAAHAPTARDNPVKPTYAVGATERLAYVEAADKKGNRDDASGFLHRHVEKNQQ